MSKTRLILLIIIIILVAGGLYLYKSPESARDDRGIYGTSDETETSANADRESADQIVGLWTSTEDANFTREFRTDGIAIDRYEGTGEAVSAGAWVFVGAGTEVLPFPSESFAGMQIIKIDFPEGEFYFAVYNLTETELSLINLSGRGNVLEFSRSN